MGSNEKLEDRLDTIEGALTAVLEHNAELRAHLEMVTTVLATIIDDARPAEPADADEWFDRLRHVALSNLRLRTDLSLDAIRRDHPGDNELLAGAERHRKQVADAIVNFMGALKRPQGSVE